MPNAQLRVLDEPTATLDVVTEHDLNTHFHEITRGHMTFLISHRFSTVRLADRILYLADGTVGGEGSHGGLLARDGECARLYRLQAAVYQEAAATASAGTAKQGTAGEPSMCMEGTSTRHGRGRPPPVGPGFGAGGLTG